MTIKARETAQYFRNLNTGYLMLFAVFGLTLLGLVMLSSAEESFRGEFRKQLIWFTLALSAGVFTTLLDLKQMRNYVWFGVAAVFVLLVLVLIPGVGLRINGARRWLDLGLMNLQVSDLARPMMVVALAHYLAKYQRELKTFWKGFAFPCVFVGATSLLIILQPDFGTSFLCALVGFTLLFLAGVRLFYLIPTILSGLVAFSVAIYLDPVRWVRITSFLDVEGNKTDSSYQLWNSILAFGAGGLSGVGLGQGRQKMSYIPEATTDFIFPVISEELGFFFSSAVVVMFIIIFSVCIWNLRKAPNLYEFLIATGAILFLTYQALINMGVVTGLLPTKGMSLPFISYGGSNLVVMFILVGLMINCFRSWAAPPLIKTRDL